MSFFDATHADPELPPVDARLAEPETRYEILDGELAHVPPADEPHGTRHSKISALVEAHVASDFDVASDMLTRTSRTSDVAPDVSVFPRARDPETGGRQLEQLAFEVVSTESLGHAGRKAAKLADRGVRRVFAIDVERARALEWSRSLATWSVLDMSAHIADPALAAPLPIEALVVAARADDAMARAFVVKRNPVIEAVKAEAKREGRDEGTRDGFAAGMARGSAEGKLAGRAEALVDILDMRGISLEASDRARILSERYPAQLRRWFARAATCVDTTELFAEP
jgi:Uma2 family endonuclease